MRGWAKDDSLVEPRFRIFETDEFVKRVSKLGRRDAGFVRNKLAAYAYPQLSGEPHFGTNIKKLAAYKPETGRYRIGKFRVFFSINDQTKIVSILTVEFRKDAY